jgi:hypothetical protein
LSVATDDRLQGNWQWEGRSARLRDAATLLTGLRDRCFGAGRPAHPDLIAWLDRIEAMAKRDSASVALPEPNFVTVE